MNQKLQTINTKLMKLYESQPNLWEKQKLIQKILAEENWVLKLDINTAYAILQDLTIPQANLAKVYLTLLNEIK